MENVHWSIQSRSYRWLGILNKVFFTTRYISWWQLSGTTPELIGLCENMIKIVSRCSLLKCDDVRLKKLTNSTRWCKLCDHAEDENILHCVMQCPFLMNIEQVCIMILVC